MNPVRLLLALLVFPAILAANTEDFTIRNLRLGMSPEAAAEAVGDLQDDANASNAGKGIRVAAVNGDESPQRMELTFLDNSLIRIVARYSEAELTKIGGVRVMMSKLTERFGKPGFFRDKPLKQGNAVALLTAAWSGDAHISLAAEKVDDVLRAKVQLTNLDALAVMKSRQQDTDAAGF